MAGVQDELARLADLPAHRLRIEWRRQFRSEPPTALSRDLLLRAVTYEVQERAYGGLSQAAKEGPAQLGGGECRWGRPPDANTQAGRASGARVAGADIQCART